MEVEEWRQMERSGNTYHMNDIRWHEVDVGEVESTFSSTLDFLMKHSATISRTAAVHTMECSWVPSSSICPPHAHLTSFMWWVFPDLLHFLPLFDFCVLEWRLKLKLLASIVPRPLPDLISQLWRKIGRRPGNIATSRGGLSSYYNQVHHFWPVT